MYFLENVKNQVEAIDEYLLKPNKACLTGSLYFLFHPL